MYHGGPHLLHLQQQSIEENTDTLDTSIDLNLQFHPRKEILAEAEEESKKKSGKGKGKDLSMLYLCVYLRGWLGE